MPKSDKTTILKRVEEILRIRLDGAQFHDIRDYADQQGWGVSRSQLKRYIRAADELLVKRQDSDREKVIARHFAQRRTIYARAVNAADYRTALAILDSEAKLHGLFPREGENQSGRATSAGGVPFEAFATDPVAYAQYVLKVQLTQDQQEMGRCLLRPPYRVKARAGHSVGKTFAAAWLVNWWYDTRDPSVTITTAPTQRDVVDLLWAEVRLQRQRAGLSQNFIGPSAPEMKTSDEHWAKGYTARKGESFQGRHRPRMLFVFDEDEGVEDTYWRTTDTMFVPDGNHAWLSIGNPTTTTSQAYREEQAAGPDGNPKWTLHTLSCLTHPNVAAGLAGLPLPVPGAVTVEQVDQWVSDWCTPVDARDRKPGDIEWRPGSGRWFRPGPVFESRVLGIRPTQATDSVWGEAAFACTAAPRDWTILDRPELGVDVARFGDDWTVIHGRRGPSSNYHTSGNGWAVDQTVGRTIEAAKQVALEWSRDQPRDHTPLDPKTIAIKVDDDGVGGGVSDMLAAQGYTVQRINAGTKARKPSDYGRRRDELWFEVEKAARSGLVSFSRLDPAVVARLKQQALAPKYCLDYQGRRIVEPKKDTKERLGRSPDDMDAVNLAYAVATGGVPEAVSGRATSGRR